MPLAHGGSAWLRKTDAGNNHEILIIYSPFPRVWVIYVPWAWPEAAGYSASQSYEANRCCFAGSWALFVSQLHPTSVLGEPASPSLGKAPAPVLEAGAISPGFTPRRFPCRRGFPNLSILQDGGDKPCVIVAGSASFSPQAAVSLDSFPSACCLQTRDEGDGRVRGIPFSDGLGFVFRRQEALCGHAGEAAERG